MEPFFLLRRSFKPNGKNCGVVRKEIIRVQFGFFELLSIVNLFVQNLQILNHNGVIIHPVLRSSESGFRNQHHSCFWKRSTCNEEQCKQIGFAFLYLWSNILENRWISFLFRVFSLHSTVSSPAGWSNGIHRDECRTDIEQNRRLDLHRSVERQSKHP